MLSVSSVVVNLKDTTLKQTRKWPWLVAGLAFLTLLFLFPSPYFVTPNLDSSWQAVLEEAFFKQWQFGKDIIFTGGPLNFLYAPTSNGYYPFLQVFAEALVLFLALFFLFSTLRSQPNWVHATLFIVLFCAAASGKDGIFLCSLGAVSLRLLRGDLKIYGVVALYGFVAVLSLMKFSFALMGFGCTALLCLFHLWQKNYKTAAQLGGIYLGAISLLWIALGQSPVNLPAYWAHSFSVAMGHQWSMQRHESFGIIVPLLLIVLLASLPILAWTVHRRKEPVSWGILGISALTLFLTWKAGVVRPDHHMTFFLQGSVLLPAMLLQFIGPRKWALSWVSVCFVTFFISCFWMIPLNREQTFDRAHQNFEKGVQTILNPGSLKTGFSDLIPSMESQHHLPAVKAHVGWESIDVLLYHQGILLLNDLNYQPRPTLQNYIAYNPCLARLNYSHMQENPPRYLLSRDDFWDGPYALAGDNLFYREFLQRYLPVLTEKDFLLLERSPESNKFNGEISVLQTKILSGQRVDVAKFSGHPLWVKVRYEPNLLQRAQALLYKPETLLLRLTTNRGEEFEVRLVGPNLNNGFLLSPLLQTNSDISNFLTAKQPLTYIDHFAILSIPGHTLFPTRQFEIEVFLLKRENLTTENTEGPPTAPIRY